jgi:PAS domain S-box-containing protein
MLKDKKIYNILVVEDNPGDYTILEDMLIDRFSKQNIDHAKTFKASAVFLKDMDLTYDVILLDLSLPDKNGVKLVEEMISIAKNIPIIVLTGYTDIEFGIKSISMGVEDYLLKEDLSPDLLYRTIVYGIQRKNAVKELEESERRYSDLFQFSPEPVMVYDMSTLQFLSINKAAIEKYGYTETEFLSLKMTDIVVDDEEINSNSTNLFRTFKLAVSIRHKKKNGELFYVEIQSSMLQLNQRQVIIINASDISLMVEYLKAIETYTVKLKEIAWTQSHIVRAPLSRMMGIVNVLKQTESNNPQFSEWIKHFENSAKELDQIILDITRKTEAVKIGDQD